MQMSNLQKHVSNCGPDELNQDLEQRSEQTADPRDHMPVLDEDTICGIGCFRPPWLQKWATSECYMVLYSIIGVVQGAYYSFVVSCISTLEKRFAFSSKISGTLLSIDEVSPLFLGILVGYFGGKAHRPRIVALGMFLNVVSCFLMVLPYAIYGPAQHLDLRVGQNKTTTTKVCDYEPEEERCGVDDNRPPTLVAVLILLFANFVKGFGNLTYYAVGLSYMDDNTKKRNTPFYFSITMALRMLGPTLGFLLGSQFLKINENPFLDPGYGPDDPRWIGAWWMGFLAQGFVLLIFTVPLALFPRRLPSQPRPQKSNYTDGQKFMDNFKGLVPALKRLAKNPIYMFLLFSATMLILGHFGHSVMLPKYMEHQFRLTAADASLASGPAGLITLQLGTVLGGFLIWKFRPSARFLTAGLAICELVVTANFFILMMPKCPKMDISNIGLTADGLNLQNQCNVNCMCTTAAFTPVCGPDGRTTYFSPCHAGCTGEETINGTQVFNNCSCVMDNNGNFITAQSLNKGFCVDEGCWNQALTYIIILPVIGGIASLLNVADTMVLLRCISPEDKSVALGAFESLTCLFAFIPYPILFGALVDNACLIWEKTCGKSGNCWFYDTDKFNYMLHGVSASFSILGTLGMIAIWYKCSLLPDLYGEDEDDQENK